jgi:MFS transporter (putative signal transducer)
MSLSSPLQAGVDFTLFQCTDAAIAILAGVVGGIVAQHFGYAACFLFAGYSRYWRRGLPISGCIRQAN